MGIDRDTARFLLWARRQGVDFTRPLTIGRMGLHLSVGDLRTTFSEFGLRRTTSELDEMFTSHAGYADRFFTELGAERLTTLDASGFEGANIIHDLNRPIPTDWHEKYSVVFDGGTLEHVFHFPTALRNCLEMTSVGGHFITVTPANNYMGHGFYQFSPELYARVLGEANGFHLEKMIVVEFGANRWHEVVDPAKVGHRVSLVNDRPTLLAVLARKTRRTEIFAQTPQQSDYASEWADWNHGVVASARPCREGERQQKPLLRRWLRGLKKWFKHRYPAKYYRPVDPTA